MHLKSYAKVNLFLDVLGIRNDGYHNIDTLFSSIDIFDSISIKKAKQANHSRAYTIHDKISFSFKSSLDLSKVDADALCGANNIICRAISLLRPYLTSLKEDILIELDKNIPIGAGLGGGSSNCACALLGLSMYLGLNLSFDDLFKMSYALGADVPFFISGGGLARAFGIGEQLSFYDFPYLFYIVIVCPSISILTKEAYSNLDLNSTIKSSNNSERFDNLITSIKENNLRGIDKYMYNAFEKGEFRRHPLLGEIKKDFLERIGVCASLMSGSGSSVYGIFESKSDAKDAFSFMKSKYPKVFLARCGKTFQVKKNKS